MQEDEKMPTSQEMARGAQTKPAPSVCRKERRPVGWLAWRLAEAGIMVNRAGPDAFGAPGV